MKRLIKDVKLIKKSGALQDWMPEKIIIAAEKSAKRADYELSNSEKEYIVDSVIERINRSEKTEIPITTIHNYVEMALDEINTKVAKSYRDYRNWKQDYANMMENIVSKANTIMYRGDKENANADSSLVSTKRSLIFNEFNKSLYEKFFLTEKERKHSEEGYYYINDRSGRRDSHNCCLFDIEAVLTGGFEMGNIWYNEPKTLDVAGDVIGDIVLSAASQQYGGFTVPEIDKVLAPYAEKSYNKYIEKYMTKCGMTKEDAENLALEDVTKEMEQVFQGWEYKFNTVASSRGDYPFTTLTFGLGTSKFERLASISALKVRRGGQGKIGHKIPVLFPKLVFLYDEKIHGEGLELEDVYEAAVDCSMDTMYPDWLSMTGEGYISDMYKTYGKVISPMGCRAFLSPWWRDGGLYKASEEDEPIFVGRFNIGVVTLNLPMILMQSRNESRDFYELLDEYLEEIRDIHLRTYAYLGKMKASCNPLGFCEGGFLGGNLNPNDEIAPCLDSATATFGYTALNELQRLYNGKSLVEDGDFALEVMQHLNMKLNEFKEADGRLYALYGTPAENLCGVQVKQFRKKYGIIENVSDREYVSNSFHCHVSEDITPIQKQDLEGRFWELSNGGKIQYVKYPINYNRNAVKTMLKRAMERGFYEGINLALSYCNECGHKELDMDSCPCCGSRDLTKIDRMNGYLAYSRVHGDTRLSEHKMAEINDRKSM